MGYNPANCVKIGALLKSHYERILYPLDVFEKEEAAKAKEEKELRKAALEKQMKEEKKVNTAKMSKAEKAEEDSKAFSKELQRLVEKMFYSQSVVKLIRLQCFIVV